MSRRLLSGKGYFHSGGGGSFTTFDPSNKSTHITLSGGNLVATSGAGSGNATSVRSVASHTTGKFYCEFTLTTGSAGSDGCGICNSSFVFDGPAFLGGNTAVGGSYFNDNSINGIAGITGAGTFTSGDVIGMAVDVGAALIWFRKNGGLWNADAVANPAIGTNGGGVSAAGALFAAVEGEVSGNVWTANFGATAYAQTPPIGFGNW